MKRIMKFIYNSIIKIYYKIRKYYKKFLKIISKILPDKMVINIDNLLTYGRFLNKNDIKYFGEKIQYLKLYGNLEQYTNYADKYKVREYVAKKIGEEYLIPLIGVYNKPEEIDYCILPNEFVLKTNHGCGYNIIVKDKEKLNINKTNKELKKWLKEDFSKIKKEYQYKNIERKIICEEFISDKNNQLLDYKFFCFDGEPKIVSVKTKEWEIFYDNKWNKLELSILPKGKQVIEKVDKPENFEKMVEIATKLSNDFQFVRVDLYNVDGRIYFGELTFTHASGNHSFRPLEKDIEIAKMIKT